MHTAIVILNWNTVDYLRQFLPPLVESTEGEDAEIIVIDNASSDGSVEMMEKEFPDIRTIRRRMRDILGWSIGYILLFFLILLDIEYFIYSPFIIAC